MHSIQILDRLRQHFLFDDLRSQDRLSDTCNKLNFHAGQSAVNTEFDRFNKNHSADEKNRNEQFRLWAKSGNPFSDYKEDFAGDSLRDRLNPLMDEYFVSQINKSIGETKKFRFTRRDVSTDGWIEPKYLNAGLKELKLEGFWDEFDANGKRKPKSK